MNICPLSQYKDIFGKPGEGVHKYRFLGVAIVDFIGTIILACIVTYISEIPLVLTTSSLFSLSLFLHVIFGVDTPAVRYLNLTC